MTKAPFKFSKTYTIPANSSLNITENFNGILISKITRDNISGLSANVKVGDAEGLFDVIDGGDAYSDYIYDVSGTFGEPVECDTIEIDFQNTTANAQSITVNFYGLIPKRK